MDLSIFNYQRPLPGLIGVEKIMLAYCAFTAILGILLYQQIDSGPSFLLYRLLFVIITLLLWLIYKKIPCQATYVVRVFFQISLLAYWYPDIYNFSKLAKNTDPIFAMADQMIFGCQPAITFSQWLSGSFWSELFYMGYFSYYLMIIAVVIVSCTNRFRRFERTTTVLLCSFILYYIVYLFLQSAGPQFYFPKIGMEAVQAGHFPAIGDWFRFHPELNYPHPPGFFSGLVAQAQQSEYPIAAFPSSHVGMATVILLLMRKLSKKVTIVLLPFYIILCLSTVYIGAHYALDVLGGLITAFLFYHLSLRIYRTRFIHRPKGYKTYISHHHHHY